MEKKVSVLVCGCKGHMGQIVCSMIDETEDMEVTGGLDTVEDLSGKFPIYRDIKSLDNSDKKPEMIIDFSSPKVTDLILEYARLNKIPIVIATTGLSEATLENITKVAKEIPIFQAPNMSFQVNLFTHLLENITKAIPEADVEITETHHNRKKDAPSGTAMILAEAIQKAKEEAGIPCEIVYGREGKRQNGEIGICSKRGGNIVGTHTVEFFSNHETFEVTHTAYSRDLFAEGAIKAAKYIKDKEAGHYNMDDLV